MEHLTIDEAADYLGRHCYQACHLMENLETNHQIFGNGHDAANYVADFAKMQLVARWGNMQEADEYALKQWGRNQASIKYIMDAFKDAPRKDALRENR